MRHPLRSVLLCLLSVSLLSGCWDAREVEERTSVVAVAVDRHKDGYEITLQVPIPINIVGAGGGGGSGDTVQVFSGTGKTLTDTLDDIRNQINQPLFFGHTRLILFGEELAKKGIGKLLDGMRRHPDIRRRQWPVVVKGKAKDALKAKPELEQIPMEYLVTMVESGVRDGRYASEELGQVFINLSNRAKQPVLNYMEISPKKIKWLGLALFKEDRMVGHLSREGSQSLLRIRDKELGETANIPCGNRQGRLVFQPKEMDRKIRVKQREGRLPEIEVHIKMKGGIVERTCDLDLSQPGIYKKMNRWVASRYEWTSKKTIRKVQKELKTDVFQFGNQIRSFHPDLWRKLDWDQVFPEVPIRVTYEVNVRRIGLESK